MGRTSKIQTSDPKSTILYKKKKKKLKHKNINDRDFLGDIVTPIIVIL